MPSLPRKRRNEGTTMAKRANAARTAALAAQAAALPQDVPLTLPQAAALLQLSPSSLRRRRGEPGFPQGYLVAGQQLRYDREDIDVYLESCRANKGAPVEQAQASRAARTAE